MRFFACGSEWHSKWDCHAYSLCYAQGFGLPPWYKGISNLPPCQHGKYTAKAKNGEDANSTAYHSATLCCWLATKSHLVLSVSSGKFLSVLLMWQAVPWHLLYHSTKHRAHAFSSDLFVGLFITMLHSIISTFIRGISLFSTEDITASLVDKNQAYFWAKRWQDGERETDEDIRAGRVKTFNSVEELVEDLEQVEWLSWQRRKQLSNMTIEIRNVSTTHLSVWSRPNITHNDTHV